MNGRGWLASGAVALVLAGAPAAARAATGGAVPAAPDAPSDDSAREGKAWEYSVSAYTFIVPGDRDYVQPAVTADRGRLHLEGRYNYEDRDTGSAWIGYNLGVGTAVRWDVTPMAGVVLGDTAGVAPGYRSTLGWWRLELYSEGEYVFDTRDSSDSFFYTWSELALSPEDWFRLGLVVQRTKPYGADRDLQRGVLAGVSYGRAEATVYVFDPDESRPTVVVGVGLDF